MPYNGSGVFTPQITLQPNTTATAEDINTLFTDVAGGLTDALTRDGEAPATAPISMGGFKINEVGAGAANSDAVNVGQLNGVLGGTTPFTGAISVPGSVDITGVAATARSLFFQTAEVNRFEIQLDAETESGSNAGSNLIINTYSDTGSFLAQVCNVNRATGVVDFDQAPQINGLAIAIVPTGAVMSFAMNGAPAGWLPCNGSAVNRTTYAALFAAIGTTYGAGDGSTTFGLPNLMGYVVRGFDSAGAVDPGRAFGSTQQDQVQNHTHSYSLQYGNGSGTVVSLYASGGLTTENYTTGGMTSGNSGSETRGKNVALLYCIKT